MRKLAGSVLAALGVALILVGLLFLVGSAGQARRLVVAAVSLALGALTTGLGVRIVRRAQAQDPARVRRAILDLARRRNGEVAETELEDALGDRFQAGRAVLDEMLAEGLCSRRVAPGGSVHLVFTDFQPRLVSRRCEYCGAELPVSRELSSCPSCGGAIATGVVRRSIAAGEVFSMDQDESPAVEDRDHS